MKQFDFSVFEQRYAIQVRLVEETDAEFIVKLRTDLKLSRFIHVTDDSVEKQRDWIREYKKREATGKDFYFLFAKDGMAFGVNRIYDIQSDRATSGSWVCQKGLPFDLPVLSLIIEYEILFEQLQHDCSYFEVRKQNKKVIKINLMLGAEQVSEDDLDYFFVLRKEKFYENRDYILKLLNPSVN